jgi:hypothetical protein
VVPVQVKHGTLRFVSKLHFNRVSRIPERILVPAPHFNVVYSGQQRIPRNRFNDFILRETIKMVRVERGHFKTTMLKHDAGSIGDTWHPDILRQRHIFASTSFEYGKTYYVFNQHPCTNTTF